MILMEGITVKKSMIQAYKDEIYPRIIKKLEKESKEARNWFRLLASNKVFQAKHRIDNPYVDLNAAYYTYKKCDLTSISCCHVLACAP